MAEPVFVANFAFGLLVLGLCLWHASTDRERLAFLGTGIVYGLLLEQIVILHFEAYRYNVADFILTVSDVPVIIGVGWTTIIYSGYYMARELELSGTALPPFVALFALHIDLAIDAVAIRVPFWTWAPSGPWFGVPLGNFFGWFLVAGLFSLGWSLLRGRAPLAARPIGALGFALAGLIVLLEAWTSVATTLSRRVAILGTLVVGSVAVLARESFAPGRVDARLAAVPLVFHCLYLAILVGFGFHVEQPLLLVVSLSMLAVGATLHLRTIRYWIRAAAAV